jgi:hypothetical protein
VNSRKANVGQSSSPRAIRDFSSGAPTQKKRKVKRNETGSAIFGLFFAVAFHSLVLWLAVRILQSAEVVAWNLPLLHCVGLSGLYLLWRTFHSYIFARMDSQNR